MTATSRSKIDLRECLVADHMRHGIVSCAPDTPLSEVAEGYRAMDERRSIKVLIQP